MKTLKELENAGYVVDIRHVRNYKVAFLTIEGKLIVKTFQDTLENATRDIVGAAPELIELLPCGGRTEMTVKDKGSGKEFTAFAMCHKNDNYDKKFGVTLCLKRIGVLMGEC